ncbi:EF-hand and coiled-coil domain-containing protein 1 [Oryzias melastigma]|uniref:EF-hand and coiled-coil domain-containing protein 1 n=1 Tax=Oryzias melastigma TaxID=30732 RepID=A0A834FBN2_ORYME|nr:EF-hand and coiled-coil domain-containing protein 1 [Oryzias melastigma]
MERTVLAAARVHPAPRAARKSEWLRSALAHHHCPDVGAENEIVVLATGIDQYLQEVFHHLAFPNQEDSVSGEDFAALCAVLGLDAARTDMDEEFRDVCAALPDQMSFKEFHSRLCAFFRARTAAQSAWRLPVSEDTELVERQIRLRWPRYRRRKCVSFDLTRDQSGAVNRSMKHRTPEQVHEPEEVAALRELVEDLRSALQGSDARCLALEVALRRERSSRITFPSDCKSPESYDASVKPNPAQRLQLHHSGAQRDGAKEAQRRWNDGDPVLRELKLIRSSRDGQLEEAIKFNQRLEEELHWAYQEVRKLQAMESSLRKENIQIRRRAEKAREALRVGLQRVRLIQEQAQAVPQLQSRISQLEAELYRGRNTSNTPDHSEDSCNQTEKHPEVLPPEAECLQRAVEGRAASDEEEDDRGLKEVKRHACHLLGCGKGCQNSAAHQFLSQSHVQEKNSEHPDKDSRSCCSRMELLKKKPDVSCDKDKRSDRLQDKEKTRLEDKFRDSLSLLLQFHNQASKKYVLKNVVKRSIICCFSSIQKPFVFPSRKRPAESWRSL